MRNASGFVNFADFTEANASEDERLMQEALAAAEAADLDARNRLRATRQQAEREAFGGGLEGDITRVGSYSDYLAAKQKAERAWAAFGAAGNDPRRAGTRDAARKRLGIDSRDEEAASRLAEIEARYGKDVAEAYRGGAYSRDLYAKQAAERAAAEKARADEWNQTTGQFYADVERKLRGGDPFTPFGRPGMNMQDQQRRAQMLTVGRAEGQWQGDPKGDDSLNRLAWGGGTLPQSSGRAPIARDKYGRPAGGYRKGFDYYGRPVPGEEVE